MSAGRAPWRYTKCDPMDDDDRGDLPLDHDAGWESHLENPMIVDADGNRIVGHGEYHVFGEKNRVDNLRLLLAAPELLAALKYARRMVKASECDIAFIDAAIQQATGEPS